MSYSRIAIPYYPSPSSKIKAFKIKKASPIDEEATLSDKLGLETIYLNDESLEA